MGTHVKIKDFKIKKNFKKIKKKKKPNYIEKCNQNEQQQKKESIWFLGGIIEDLNKLSATDYFQISCCMKK